MESPSSSTLNVSLPQDDEENPSETPAANAADAPSSISTTQQQQSEQQYCSGCYIALLICVLVPSIVGLVVLFGIFAIPVVILACFGVSLFCMSTPTGGEYPEEEAFKNLTKSEMRKRLIVRDNAQEGCCEICLNDFEGGSSESDGLVVASPNPSCCHVFHQECVLQWLEKKPTCPCCRALYLSNVEQGQNDDDEEEEATSSTGDNVVVELRDVDDDSSIDYDSEPPEGWDVWISNMINASTVSLNVSVNNEEAEQGGSVLAT